MASTSIRNYNRDIKALHAGFIPCAEFILSQKIGEWNVFLVEGFRTKERQQYLYDSGRKWAGFIKTYARAGQSVHNYGMAVDVAFQHERYPISLGVEKPNYNKELYAQLYKQVKNTGIDWGGNWWFKDYGHFEIKNINQINMYELFKEKGSKDVYANINSHACLITNKYTFNKGKEMGMWGDWEDIKKVGKIETNKGADLIFSPMD